MSTASAIVPQGGNTGLVGGGVPLDGEVVLSLERMPCDPDGERGGRHAVAEAGADALCNAARLRRRRVGPTASTSPRATRRTIGGNIATNAGGLRVMRYGDTRRQLIGVEFVTGTGRRYRVAVGDAAQHRLSPPLAGLRQRRHARASSRPPGFALFRTTHERRRSLRFDDPARGLRIAAESLRRRLADGRVRRAVLRGGRPARVRQRSAIAPPFEDISGGTCWSKPRTSPIRRRARGARSTSLAGVADVAVATDAVPSRRPCGNYRDRHTEAISRAGIPHKLDVAVPPGSHRRLRRSPSGSSGRAEVRASINFGHAGEAAIHVNVIGLPPMITPSTTQSSTRPRAGRHHQRGTRHRPGQASVGSPTASQRALRSSIKAAFDPDGIMNPAVLAPI